MEKQKEMQDRLIRTFADMENVRNIARKDVENAKAFAVQKFAKSLLGVSDNLSRAIGSVKTPEESVDPQMKVLLEGVQMTDAQLKKVFKEFGVVEYGAEGDPFDPQKHEALYAMDASEGKAPNTVGEFHFDSPSPQSRDCILRMFIA
jgi:molecular chaperone GrpE